MFRFSCGLMLLLASTSCKKEPVVGPPEVGVNKTIRFTLAQGQDYSAPTFQNLRAEVTLSVSRENLQNGTNAVVWDTVFTLRNIRQYPLTGQPLEIQRQVIGVFENRESVRVSRAVKYVYEDQRIVYNGSGETIPQGVMSRQYDMRL